MSGGCMGRNSTTQSLLCRLWLQMAAHIREILASFLFIVMKWRCVVHLHYVNGLQTWEWCPPSHLMPGKKAKRCISYISPFKSWTVKKRIRFSVILPTTWKLSCRADLNLLPYELCSSRTKRCLESLKTNKSIPVLFIHITHKGDLFVLPIFSILTTTFAFRHRSWFFPCISSLVVLLFVLLPLCFLSL